VAMGLISHVVSRHLYVLMSCVSQGQMQYQIQYYVVYTVTRVHISNICVINNAPLEKVIGLIRESKLPIQIIIWEICSRCLHCFQIQWLFTNTAISTTVSKRLFSSVFIASHRELASLNIQRPTC